MTQHPLSLASFFTIEAREYANFTLDAAARSTLRNVILAFCIGILLASLYTLYQKLVPGGIVRAILKAQAHTPEAAKTLAELGLDKNPLYGFELRHNAMLNKTVARATAQDKDAPEAERDEDDAKERLYIPEELKYRAELRFDKKGNGVAGLVLTAVLTVALAILLIKLMPAVLSMVDGLLKK